MNRPTVYTSPEHTVGPVSEPAAWWQVAYEYCVLYGALTVFGVSGLMYTALAPLVYLLLPRRVGRRLGQRIMQALFRWFVGRLEATGLVKCDLDALDTLRNEHSLVIAPNHLSLLDAVLIVSRLPNVVCVVKASIWNNVFLGGGARLAGYISNGSLLKMIKLGAQALRADQHVLAFPEGTRTVAKPVNSFKASFALIARQGHAPIQTVFIESNTAFLGKGWPLFKKPRFPLLYSVRLGKRFTADGDVHELIPEMEAYFRRELGGEKA